MYSTGIGAPEQNQAKAMLYYTFAALGQDPSSEMALGYRYLAGIGTQKNCDEAVWYYRKAAQKSGLIIPRLFLPRKLLTCP